MLALIAVSYYEVNGNDDRAERAFADYEDKPATRFGHLQAEFQQGAAAGVIRPIRRASVAVWNVPGARCFAARAPAAERGPLAWREHHDQAFAAQGPVSEALAHMAEEMRLAAVAS
jgi:hypothetical protein